MNQPSTLKLPCPQQTNSRLTKTKSPSYILALALASLVGILPSMAHAATFQVTNLNDSGSGSLRTAVASANANADSDTITFASTLKGTLILTSGELPINQNVSITGPGKGILSISADNRSRLFNITGGVVSISGLTLTKGQIVGEKGADSGSSPQQRGKYDYYRPAGAPGGSATGGAILNLGTLTLTGVALTSNQAIGGDGGIGAPAFISGGVIPEAHYFAGAGGQGGDATGGAIYNGGTLNITGTTFVSNRAVGGNGGKGGDARFSLVAVSVGLGGRGGDALGGAIYNAATGTLHISPTYSGNTVGGGNGGLKGIYLPNGKPGSASSKGVSLGANLFDMSTYAVPVVLSATISGKQGEPLSAQLQATGGAGSLTYTLVEGSLPAGLTLDAQTGAISGTPTQAGAGQKVKFQVSDGLSQSLPAIITFNIKDASSDTTAPAVQVNTPTSNQQIALSVFGPSTVTGSARDNVGVTDVQVRLSRTRNGVVQYWNGRAFTTTLTFLTATLSSTAAQASNWVWNKNLPPASALDAGTYKISAYATDAAGNTSGLGSRTFVLTASAQAASAANS